MIELTFNEADLRAIEAEFAEVADKIAKKALRKAARDAMKPVKDTAKANAPVDTGLLKSDFAISTKIKDGTVYAKVGVIGGAKENPETPWYFRLQEFGTKDIPAKPFMLPALESNAQNVLDILTAELKEALDK